MNDTGSVPAMANPSPRPAPHDLLGQFDLVAALAEKDEEHRCQMDGLLAAITQALDSFARVLGPEPDTPLAPDRLRLIQRQFAQAVRDGGYELIGVRGEVAAPKTHRVVGVRADAGGAREDEVLDVVRLGCRHQGRVLRPAEVIIAVPEDSGTPPARSGREGAEQHLTGNGFPA
jgi:hypothetical protein